MTNFNERTNTLLYKNISHTLFSKGLILLVCEGWAGDGDRELFWRKVLLSTVATLLSHLDWVAQLWVTEDPNPSVCRWLSLRHLVPNWLHLVRTASGTWLYNCPTSTCFRCSCAYLYRCISWRLGPDLIWRLPGLKKEVFGELLITSRVPCWYYWQRTYATWEFYYQLKAKHKSSRPKT